MFKLKRKRKVKFTCFQIYTKASGEILANRPFILQYKRIWVHFAVGFVNVIIKFFEESCLLLKCNNGCSQKMPGRQSKSTRECTRYILNILIAKKQGISET